jgi:hypothetical protein
MSMLDGFTVRRCVLETDLHKAGRQNWASRALAPACRTLADFRFASRRARSEPRRRMAGACRSLPIWRARRLVSRGSIVKACRSLLIPSADENGRHLVAAERRRPRGRGLGAGAGVLRRNEPARRKARKLCARGCDGSAVETEIRHPAACRSITCARMGEIFLYGR